MIKKEALYLKYRPQNFSQLIGQEHIKRVLQNAIKTNNFSHAYLFSGPRGTGKTTTARILAKAINCPNQKDGEPCNKCEFCQEITKGKSIDIIEIDAASNRGIDEIRDLREKVKYAPSKLKYKVYIIDEVHMLTREAFNALLKTLEEPPQHVIFILATTEIHKVPETIISRCQRFDFNRIKINDLIKYLKIISQKEKIKINDKSLEIIAYNAGGAFRDAVNLLDQASTLNKNITQDIIESIIGFSDWNDVYRLLDFLIQGDPDRAVDLINEILEKGYDLEVFNKKMIEHLRKIMVFKISQKGNLLEITKEQLEKIKEQANYLSTDDILKIVELFLKTKEGLKISPIPQLPLELAVLKINQILSPPNKTQNKNQIEKISTKELPEKNNQDDVSQKNQKQDSKDKEGVKLNNSHFNNIIDCWEEILESTKKYNHSICAFLKACQPVSLDNNVLHLDFIYNFHRDKISEPKNRDIVEKCIKDVSGVQCRIQCNFNPQTIKKNESKKDKIEEKEKSDDDLLNEALNIFGGEIIE